MKKIIAAAALMLMAATTSLTAQTKRVMTVIKKDGTAIQYKVNGVERVTFSDVELPSLRNQIALDDDIQGVTKATLCDNGGYNEFALYTAEADTANAIPTLRIVIAKDLMGQELTLGADSESDVAIYYKGEQATLQGTLQVRFGRTGTVVINLETETADYSDLRCRYASNYSQVFTATNTISVEKAGTAAATHIQSAFIVKPATTGAATTFAFGDAEGAVPDSLVNGTQAVSVSISASKLYNDTIDMANDKDSYSFQFIDYASREVYDKVTAGTIISKQDAEGNIYVHLVATLDDGRQVTVDYYGPVTEADSLDAMIPAAVAANEYKYYNSDGDLNINRQFGTSYIKTDKKGNITFYLIPEGEGKSSSYKVQLQVSPDLINAGEKELANLGETAIFYLRFDLAGIQLQSTASGHGYGNTPNNGTVTITKTDDDVYDITLDVYNRYSSMYTTNGGDNTHLVLHYNGTFEQY